MLQPNHKLSAVFDLSTQTQELTHISNRMESRDRAIKNLKRSFAVFYGVDSYAHCNDDERMHRANKSLNYYFKILFDSLTLCVCYLFIFVWRVCFYLDSIYATIAIILCWI